MNKLFFLLSIACLLSLTGCQKEKITLGNNADETFYVDNDGEGMKVTVRGNTASKVMLLIVHGGPGGTSSSYPMPVIREKYALAYWDQRIGGSSQGGSNATAATLETYVMDMKKVILTLKYRYGQDISLFVFGHSWGGTLSTAFVTTAGNQQLLKGWIYCEGVHNFPLLDSLVKDKLLTTGISKIAENNNPEFWQPIVDYCHSLSDTISADESLVLNAYSFKAEQEVLKDVNSEAGKYPDDAPQVAITSFAVNSSNPANVELFKSLHEYELSSALNVVTLPALVTSGVYDFTTPSGLGDDLFSNIASTVKTRLILDHSGHNVQQWDLVMSEILKFMDANK